MNVITILIASLIALCIILIALIVVYIIIKKRRDVPRYMKRDIGFSGGVDVKNGMVSSAQNELQLANKIKGTIVLNIDGQIAGVNPSSHFYMISLLRIADNVIFRIDISEKVTLGRIQIDNPHGYCCVSTLSDVSKYHCCIWRRNDGAIMICDNNSTNHTFVNNIMIEAEAEIHTGDVIRLGNRCNLKVL